jgi:hypothetical protein
MALSPPPAEVVLVDNEGLHDPGPGDPELSDPEEDGSTEHPFDAIQEALDRVAPGESVVILPGVYAGRGNHDLDVRGKPITVRSVDPSDSSIVAATVIDCQGVPAEMRRAFEFHRGESTSTAVCGLTVMNGYTSKGSAIYCSQTSNPTIAACVFTKNVAAFEVAGLVTGSGGAVACDESSPVVRNCVFGDNVAEIEGGAVCNRGGRPTITNCTFVRNLAAVGGGMYSEGPISPDVANCIFWENVPEQIVGDVLVSHSDVQGGWAGRGNFDAAPLFVDPDHGAFHLMSETGRWDSSREAWIADDVTSSCIDAGDPNADWAAEPWPHGRHINTGAYGGTPEASMSSPDVGAMVDLDGDELEAGDFVPAGEGQKSTSLHGPVCDLHVSVASYDRTFPRIGRRYDATPHLTAFAVGEREPVDFLDVATAVFERHESANSTVMPRRCVHRYNIAASARRLLRRPIAKGETWH